MGPSQRFLPAYSSSSTWTSRRRRDGCRINRRNRSLRMILQTRVQLLGLARTRDSRQTTTSSFSSSSNKMSTFTRLSKFSMLTSHSLRRFSQLDGLSIFLPGARVETRYSLWARSMPGRRGCAWSALQASALIISSESCSHSCPANTSSNLSSMANGVVLMTKIQCVTIKETSTTKLWCVRICLPWNHSKHRLSNNICINSR